MSPTKSDVLALVNAAPDGITTREVRARLSGTDYCISNNLSRLYAYGEIDKQSLGGNRALWKRRERT